LADSSVGEKSKNLTYYIKYEAGQSDYRNNLSIKAGTEPHSKLDIN